MNELKATPGPWRWEINLQSKIVHLVGGKPQFDKTVMDFERWGMGGAAPRFNEAIAGNEYNIMSRVHEKREWIKPFDGRAHHAKWCAAIDHPDAALIAAAPEIDKSLLTMCNLWVSVCNAQGWAPDHVVQYGEALAALKKARGEA